MDNRDKISSLYEIQTKIADSRIFDADYSEALVPRETNKDELFVQRNSDYVSAFPFIDGVTYFDGSSLNVVEEVGRAYGNVNRVLSNYRPSNSFWPISRPLTIERHKLDAAYDLQKVKADMDPVCYLLEKEFTLICESLEEVSMELPDGEPSLVELHPHNIFFKGERCVLIFDYETVTNQWPEIAACAYAIHRFCREYARNKRDRPEAIKKSVEAFLKGYKKGRGREFPEIHDKLHWWIKRTNLPKLIRALSYVTDLDKNRSNRPRAVLASEVVKFIACLKEADAFKM